jgi:hypothetical protein
MALVVGSTAFRQKKTPYKIKFILTHLLDQVPESFKMLGRQRRQWHLELIQAWFSISHCCSIKYGGLGMFVMPYYPISWTLARPLRLLGYLVSFFLIS